MDKIIAIAQVIVPIFVTVFLGILAKRKTLLTQEQVQGLQQFVMQFGIPCLIFNSCLTANIDVSALGTMALVLPFILVANLWAFRARKKSAFAYHNLPQLFGPQETGMIGIPLFTVLFGASEAYRMGILDLNQAIISFPTIAILSTDVGTAPSIRAIVKKILTTPMVIMCFLALALNLSGIGTWLAERGVRDVITGTTGFLAQPVSALMIFCAGYNLSLDRESRGAIIRLSALHFAVYAVFCVLIQLGLFLIPNVDALTRWSILMYTTLPASYLAPALGRSQKDFTVASGVCSLLTIVCLIVFAVMAVCVL
ncbi:MAG: AEC family transporter [Oscillospiraceae bacterium]|nr:AEC family transporter [Oscillospiraceae bacterium]